MPTTEAPVPGQNATLLSHESWAAPRVFWGEGHYERAVSALAAAMRDTARVCGYEGDLSDDTALADWALDPDQGNADLAWDLTDAEFA